MGPVRNDPDIGAPPCRHYIAISGRTWPCDLDLGHRDEHRVKVPMGPVMVEIVWPCAR